MAEMKNRVGQLKKYLDPVFETLIIDFIGILFLFRFPQQGIPSVAEMTSGLVETLTGKSGETPINFSWSLGYLSKRKDAFVNFAVKTYELREFKVLNDQKASNVTINIDTLPVTESGVEVVVDVNNRPQKTKGSFVEGTDLLMAHCEEEIRSLEKRVFCK